MTHREKAHQLYSMALNLSEEKAKDITLFIIRELISELEINGEALLADYYKDVEKQAEKI